MYQDKSIKLILALNKNTKNKSLLWSAIDTPLSFDDGTEDRIPVLYVCNYKEKTLALYLRRYKYFYDEHDFYWAEKKCLSIINDQYQILWESDEQGQAINDLYSTVTEQASGIDDLLNDLLDID
ncbi:TPA: hypothetical protein ACU94I_001054 [Klebsiella aerogenes]|uniref:hypothetical protein n=1 Tax=Klebsiella aerogenes TaxID=548 RepID=UPI000FAF7966|nr:hypothetical protein [Salmonella enterica subsp. enterica serovar Tennessee]MKV44980.1 hypothetical protein [Salmonella enterica subsp. enterica serovar Okatie]